MRRPLLAFLIVLVLAGCNTMMRKSYQKITIHTEGIENVDCILETEKAKYRILAPGIAEVDRSDLPMTVTCQKVQYLTSVKTLPSRINMMRSQLNVFNGIIPGIAWDVASNSIYYYPDTVVMKMRPDPNKVTLPPLEKYELPLKAEITPEDVLEALPPEGIPAEDAADKTFNQSLKK